jgi:hypothetical protein
MFKCRPTVRAVTASGFLALAALVVTPGAYAQSGSSALPPHPCQISAEMCVDYTKQQADNGGLLFDEDGNVSPPRYVGPAEINPIPLTPSLGSLGAYIENAVPDPTGGVVTRDAETASHRDVPVDHCTPAGPDIDHRYDRQREKPNYYVAAVGVSCDTGVDVHCFIELWRVHDQNYWTDSHPSSGLKGETCYAQVVSSFYAKRTKHYATAHLRMVSEQGVWKRDPGSARTQFEGWRCNGWRSNVLDCTRQTATIS